MIGLRFSTKFDFWFILNVDKTPFSLGVPKTPIEVQSLAAQPR